MVDIEKLQEDELEQLQEEKVEVTKEYSLEELILLGEDAKTPIIIQYPLPDGRVVKAKAFVKQLTMKELSNVDLTGNDVKSAMSILQRALFKENGDTFKKAELEVLPIGVIREVANLIMRLSGMDENQQAELANF